MDEPLTISMDAAGRLVIPAALRRELALVGGAEFVVDVQAGILHLRPTGRAAVAVRGRRLVVRSPLVGPVPDHRALRDEHLARSGGE